MDSGGQELGYGGAGLHRGVDEEREVDVEVFNLDSDVNEDVCVRNGMDSPGKDTREHLSHHCRCPHHVARLEMKIPLRWINGICDCNRERPQGASEGGFEGDRVRLCESGYGKDECLERFCS
jgi:hypothetical protein